MSYEDRLKTLNLLRLTYDQEIRDLVLVYKCIFGHTEHLYHLYIMNRTRTQNPSLV
jgi:hypothetical protein